MRRFQHVTSVTGGLVLLVAAGAWAVPAPEVSLNTCQEKVRTEGKKFVQSTVNAASTCLKHVAVDLIKNSGVISTATSKTCVTQFRKLKDTRVNDQSIEEKFKRNVDKKCEPGFSASVTHALNDITAHAGGGVTEKIKSVNIDTWCKNFGGDGSIDSVPEWQDCLVASLNCQAAMAIGVEFPRAVEWLTTLTTPLLHMNAVGSPSGDPSRTSDAVAGASDFRDLIDPDGDGIASASCGGEGVACVTACCYVENPAAGPPADVNCFEYTAPSDAVDLFSLACVGPGTAGFQIKTAVAGVCVAGPAFGTSCSGPPAKVTLPADSRCP